MFKQTALSSLDSYKLGHPDQYPQNTTKVSSNFTPRSLTHFKVPYQYSTDSIIWYGALAAYLSDLVELWNNTFFNRTWEENEKEIASLYLPFCGPKGFNSLRLKALYTLGYLPLEIKALPEGSQVPTGVPVLVITNTRDSEYWLPNSLETDLSYNLWRPSTSASIAFVYRKILTKWAKHTGGSEDFVMWQGHDFSARGMGGFYDAARSGAGHLTSFWGTDNIPAASLVKQVYGDFMYGSVPATEHAVMCAGGKENEIDTFKRLIKLYPAGVFSVVSDTWNFWNVVGGPDSIAAKLKEEILSRQDDAYGLGKTVFRPDSGDPVLIISGYNVWDQDVGYLSPCDLLDDGYDCVKYLGKYFTIDYLYDSDGVVESVVFVKEISEYGAKGAVQCLFDIFGGTTNALGYNTLNRRVGLIYGDSITMDRAEAILSRLANKGYASDNVVFGIGSFTYQYQTRDTLGFAMKATYVEKDGVGEAIFKDPVTDSGTKKSAKGLLRVDMVNDKYVLKDNVSKEQAQGGALRPVFINGTILLNESFEDIRARVNNAFSKET